MVSQGYVARIAAKSICLPLVAKDVGFALHATPKRWSSSENFCTI